MLKKLLSLLGLLASLGAGQAQTVYTPPASAPEGQAQVLDLNSPEFLNKTAEMKAQLPLNVTVETVGSALAPEERKRLEELANQITSKTMNRYETEGSQFEQLAMQAKRRADDIASAALAGSREKVLKFLGIDPKGATNLYYFVSFSMPLDMLRSYVLDAMWSGGTIVVRGVPKGRTLNEFFTEDLRQLIYGKGASANLSLDPRLFEAYDVQAVPAIVYTQDRSQLICNGLPRGGPVAGGKPLSFNTCAQLESDKYWKMSGAVTSDYALRAFMEQGALGAKTFHDALRKGMAAGSTVPKGQAGFAGVWKDAISPDDLMASRAAIEAERQKQQQANAIPE